MMRVLHVSDEQYEALYDLLDGLEGGSNSVNLSDSQRVELSDLFDTL